MNLHMSNARTNRNQKDTKYTDVLNFLFKICGFVQFWHVPAGEETNTFMRQERFVLREKTGWIKRDVPLLCWRQGAAAA